MKVSDREQEFVLRYFQAGKLDTQKALQKVKARCGANSDAKTMKRKPRYWIAVAASLLVLVAVGTYALLRPKNVMLISGTEVLACHLPDGTQVTLAPHSSLSYPEDDCRKVEMKGCAYFQVRHDELHPFDVDGERGHVRVLGTQFLVDERSQRSVVLVTSGRVFFSARDAKEGVLLTKGEQARLLQGQDKPQMMGKGNVNDVAWATHRLHFDNTPLSEVLRRLSECNGGIELKASDMNKRLTGDFPTDSLQQTLRIIEQTLDIKIK